MDELLLPTDRGSGQIQSEGQDHSRGDSERGVATDPFFIDGHESEREDEDALRAVILRREFPLI